mmetsp:Transcript_31526/g.30853  ORF Transcript_31526/g.30853 Transcript_31526/m.30853 type:complete len:106 (+) Transcript_31526:779-1096(+)
MRVCSFFSLVATLFVIYLGESIFLLQNESPPVPEEVETIRKRERMFVLCFLLKCFFFSPFFGYLYFDMIFEQLHVDFVFFNNPIIPQQKTPIRGRPRGNFMAKVL